MRPFVSLQTWGFTKNEIRVIILLSSTLLLGLLVRWYIGAQSEHPATVAQFDYSNSDREFAERSKRLSELSLPPVLDKQKKILPTAKPQLKPQSININTATKTELMSLPGIGEQYAERIILYRQDAGPFTDINDLQKVKGIGKKILEKLKPFIVVE